MTTDERLTRIEEKLDVIHERVTTHHAWLTFLGAIGSIVVPAVVAWIVSSMGGCHG